MTSESGVIARLRSSSSSWCSSCLGGRARSRTSPRAWSRRRPGCAGRRRVERGGQLGRRRPRGWRPRSTRSRRRPRRSRPATAPSSRSWRTRRGGCPRRADASGTRSGPGSTVVPDRVERRHAVLPPLAQHLGGRGRPPRCGRRGSPPRRRRSGRARPARARGATRHGQPPAPPAAACTTLRSLTAGRLGASTAGVAATADRSPRVAPRRGPDRRALEVVVVVDGQQVGERRRLREQLECQPVPGVVGVEQVAGEREQPPAILGADVADGQVLVQPRPASGSAKVAALGVTHSWPPHRSRARCIIAGSCVQASTRPV